MTITLGLVDSGAGDRHKDALSAARRFDQEGALPVAPDTLGHGTAICDILRHHAPQLRLYNAQVFDARGVTTAAVVAAAIDWLVAQKVDMINLSLGLTKDRDILRRACERAVAANIILIAASPAQGQAVYPSSYEGIIRATGDARCDVSDISFLDSTQADFGGCPRPIRAPGGQPPRGGGASLGTAHISGRAAAYLQGGGAKSTLRDWLVSQAKYVHSERRTK